MVIQFFFLKYISVLTNILILAIQLEVFIKRRWVLAPISLLGNSKQVAVLCTV